MTATSLSAASPARVAADAVVVGVTGTPAELAVADGGQSVEAAMGRSFLRGLAALGVDGSGETVTVLPTNGAIRAPVVAVVGLGPTAGSVHDLETLRRAAGAAARKLAGTASEVAIALPASDPRYARAVVEGVLLGGYAFPAYRTGNELRALGRITMLSTRARDRDVARAVEWAEHVATSVNLARDWVNTPPNDLTPASFADRARALARETGLDVEVLDERALERGGYGGVLAVGRGSVHPPRLVRVAYRPRRPKARLALVGKGITFDSGGLSLKRADRMLTMKCDMSGAAAVVTATAAIARMGLPVQVVAHAALAENMPSATAQRPSDVYRAYGGKTVEVLNTDAEGRLVLADALVRAQEEDADALVDIATLTGGMVIALGSRIAGLMGNDEALRDAVLAASARAGEELWPMPLPRDLRRKLDSAVADIANVGERWGGCLQAGLFLQEFVAEGRRWAHLDIAGPAFNVDAAYGYTPKGGTGVGVRTLVALAEAAANGGL